MGALDEVSSEIGRLRAAVEMQNAQVGALFRKYDEQQAEVIEHRGVIRHLGETFLKHATDDSAAHAKIGACEKRIDAYENQGKGAKWAFGFFGVSGVAGIYAAVKAFIGAGGAVPGQ